MATFFAPLSKIEKLNDGTLRVCGIASSESVDESGEVIKASAMKAALPNFFRHGTGALRVMHQPIAAGTVDKASIEDGVTVIEATVVDADAIKKIEKGVLKGFSVGGKVKTRDPLNKRVITEIVLTEVSLVDRPCNPDAVLQIWKAADMHPASGAVLSPENVRKALDSMPESERAHVVTKAAMRFPQSIESWFGRAR